MAGTSLESSTPERLGVGHTVFLSHSGENKDFVGILTPFFDQDSLLQGDKVNMFDILDVVKTCKLGLIVISDHFFCKTKNPMLELSTFVEHGIHVLPLFYKLSVNGVKDKKNKAKWKEIWSQWSANDISIDIPKWDRAVDALTATTGPEYDHLATNLIQYARIVADEVCRILPPNICPSDVHVQGKTRLFQEVKRMFAKAPEVHGAKVLALYGMEGVGKSTLCLALRNLYNVEFAGRVCYVEFTRSRNGGGQNCLRLEDILTISLRLTHINLHFAKTHLTDVDKGIAFLDTHLSNSSKFLLILDNIHEYSQDEARKLVLNRSSFPCGSHLLFLGRSRNSLASLLGPIDNGHMICPFPDLHHHEVEQIFLNETLFFLQEQSIMRQRQQMYDEDRDMQVIVKECVNLCRVSGSHTSCNPLMLKSLASFLRSSSAWDPINWSRWKKIFLNLKRDRNEAMQSMFQLLQQSYDMLHQREKDLFLDLALYTLTGKDVRKLHFEEPIAGVSDYLRNLTDAFFWSKDDGVLGVHRDFARTLARKSDDKLFVQGLRLDPGSLNNIMHAKRGQLEKLAFVDCKFLVRDGCLDLSDSKCIGVLLVDNVEGLSSVNLGLKNRLCRLEVNSRCALQVEGINTSSLTLCTQSDARLCYNQISLLVPLRLVILELGGINNSSWEVDATHLGRCGSLKFLQLESIKLTNENLDLSYWPLLVELKLANLAEAAMLSGLQNLQGLRKFSLAACGQLSALHLPGSLRHCSVEKCRRLSKIEIGMLPVESPFDEEDCTAENVFSVCDCEELEELSGLCEFQHIEFFKMVGLSRLHKVKGVLDFSQGSGATDCAGIPCFISCMELAGDANIKSLRQLSVQQVSKRGFVRVLVEELLKDASDLEKLMVKCGELGLCGCNETCPPRFDPKRHVQFEYDCHLRLINASPSQVSFSKDESLDSSSKLHAHLDASFSELENQESISEVTADLRGIQSV